MPTSGSTDTTAEISNRGLHIRRSAEGIVLDFPVMRAPGVSLGLAAFGLLCGVIPAIGLSAVLPLESANAMAMISLALVGGLAAPFILASVVFLLLAVYLSANALHVEIDGNGIRTVRRVFGRVTRLRQIACDDIGSVEPHIGARYQNVFSSTPRYALIAMPRDANNPSVVVAEDLAGEALMREVRALICSALRITINQ